MASFTRTYSDQDLRLLLQMVVDEAVAEHALTQAEYDRAREQHGYADTPRAKYIAKRLGQSWTKLAAQAFQQQAARPDAAREEHAGRRAPSEIISQAAVKHALATILRRLDQDEMSAIQYERERQALIAAAADKEEAYALDEALPSAQRLQAVYKTWAGVCEAAGIKAPEGSTAKGPRSHTNPGSYDLAACQEAMLKALKWAAENERELTQRAYQEYAGSREGIPSLNAMQGILKREELGSFADYRSSVQTMRLKHKL